jgi:pyruvate-ferredoxin/flavodoxin oxidoreductase
VAGENPLQLDSRRPKIPVEEFMYLENRFKMLKKSNPEEAKRLLKEAQHDVDTRWRFYEYMAARPANGKAEAATMEKVAKTEKVA